MFNNISKNTSKEYVKNVSKLFLAGGEYVMSTHELLEKEMQTSDHLTSYLEIPKFRYKC